MVTSASKHQTASINRNIARHYNLKMDTGVLVLGVEPNSPAEKVGLREGDLIVALAGEQVEGVNVLHRLLSEARINTRTTLVVIRGTHRLELRVVPELKTSR